MKKNVFSNTLKLLATGSLSLFMAACYGPPAIFDKTVKVTNKDNIPIPELKITLINQTDQEIASEFTDKNGIAVFDYTDIGPCDTLKIKDIDSTANDGDFGTREISIDPEDYDIEVIIE